MPTVTLAAKHCVKVHEVDIAPKVVEMTNHGKLHIIEPCMEEYFRDETLCYL